MDAPREDLRRAEPARVLPAALRADSDGDTGDEPRHLFGHFARFNEWTEIDSYFEGNFLERIAPGAFKKTIGERVGQIRVLYDHGYDPELGNKPLGTIEELKEESVGPYYDVRLIDTAYNRDFIIPAADEGLLGASFRFQILQEEWNDEPDASDANPKGLPERTVKEVRLFEFGPVTFPAYEGATVGLRSKVEFDLWRSLDDTGRRDLLELARRSTDLATSTDLEAASGTSDGDAGTTQGQEPPEHSGLTSTERQRVLQLSGVRP